MLTSRIEEQEKVGSVECAICLIHFDVASVIVRVTGDNDRTVYLNGYVSHQCLVGGPEQIAKELPNRAASERRAAKPLERWADEPIVIPEGTAAVVRSSAPLGPIVGRPPGSTKGTVSPRFGSGLR